jgi:hypothetical protein
MPLRASNLIVMGAEAATKVCFLAIPAATIRVWSWPISDLPRTGTSDPFRSVAIS